MVAAEHYTRLLTDEEIRDLLQSKGVIVFEGLSREWQEVERQIEKLGFGGSYIVTQRKGPHGNSIKAAPITE